MKKVKFNCSLSIICWNKWYVILHLGLHPFNSMSCTFTWMNISFQLLTNLKKRHDYSNGHKLVYKYVSSPNWNFTFSIYTFLSILPFLKFIKVRFTPQSRICWMLWMKRCFLICTILGDNCVKETMDIWWA